MKAKSLNSPHLTASQQETCGDSLKLTYGWNVTLRISYAETAMKP